MPTIDDLEKLRSAMAEERATWDVDFKDIARHLFPRGVRFDTQDANKGGKKSTRIIDNTAVHAVNIGTSAMFTGTANPSRPWFDMKFRSPKLVDNQAGRAYLQDVKDVLANILTKSNFYDQLPRLIKNLFVFGSGAMPVLEDSEDVVRFDSFPIGTFVWASNYKGRIDALSRIYRMSIKQMAQQFGEDALSSRQRGEVRDKQKAETSVDVVWTVCPNADHKPGNDLDKFKRFGSYYYQLGDGNDGRTKFLRQSGFDEFPILGARWGVTGEDSWGTGPGHEVLDDTKELYQLHLMKAKGNSRGISPPLLLPSTMQGKVNLLPDALNYSVGMDTSGVRSIYQGSTYDGSAMLEMINDTRGRIRSGLFQDLFLMFANSDRRQITAAEIVARNQEKVLVLANVLERLNQEVFDPLIDRLFGIAQRRGLLPEPPSDLEGEDIAIEYISTMAQESKQTGIAAIDRFAGFINGLAAVNPSVLDKVDFDQAIDEVASMLGVPARIVKSDEQVAFERDQRAQQQAQRQAMETMESGAKAARDLSQANTSGDNALADLLAAGPR